VTAYRIQRQIDPQVEDTIDVVADFHARLSLVSTSDEEYHPIDGCRQWWDLE
jgi:hypothetical protein